MRLPGAVGIDSRDRRGVRRDAGEILTSLMLVYVANLGMDYVVRGPGAIRRACYASIIFFGHGSSKARASDRARRCTPYRPAGSAPLT
jgi:hypothetical protein